MEKITIVEEVFTSYLGKGKILKSHFNAIERKHKDAYDDIAEYRFKLSNGKFYVVEFKAFGFNGNIDYDFSTWEGHGDSIDKLSISGHDEYGSVGFTNFDKDNDSDWDNYQTKMKQHMLDVIADIERTELLNEKKEFVRKEILNRIADEKLIPIINELMNELGLSKWENIYNNLVEAYPELNRKE